MIRTLRESKATLSQLVDRANRGEDVLITVRGKVKARLTRPLTALSQHDREVWAEELRALHKSMRVSPKPKLSFEQILDEDREDRV
jgi:antitoxin (DNA-binding transcriptional repressor) of toxin-antitoxin stability system